MTPSSEQDHRPRGRRPGSPETRPQILTAARDLFAAQGFAATSIRAIAQEAGVDAALVHHYYGTKEGLFRAALDVPIDPQTMVTKVLADGPDGAAVRLVNAVMDVWDDDQTGPAMLGFLRRVLSDAGSTELVREFVTTIIIREAAGSLLHDVDHDEAETRISLVMSQLVGVIVARKVLLLEPLVSMSRAELLRRIAPVIDAHLAGMPDALHSATDHSTTTKEAS